MFNDAIVYDRYGPPSAVLTLKRLPLAPLAGGRVRIRMRFAPVNPSDLIPVTGAYRHRTRLPAVAGYEGLGEVVAAPYGSRLAAGQRVLPLRGGGTWQRFIDLDETWLVPVPPAVDDSAGRPRVYQSADGDADAQALAGCRKTPRADRGIVLLRQSAGAVGAGDGRPLGERDYSLAAAPGAPGTGRDLSDPRYRPGADGEGQPAQRSRCLTRWAANWRIRCCRCCPGRRP